MIPGEYVFDGPDIELNAGRPVLTLKVTNTGDRPIQIGAHYHFFETNKALVFDRAKAYGMRLDLPSGTSVRSPVLRSLTSTVPVARPRPTTTIVGTPSSSESLNFTPGDTPRRSASAARR